MKGVTEFTAKITVNNEELSISYDGKDWKGTSGSDSIATVEKIIKFLKSNL